MSLYSYIESIAAMLPDVPEDSILSRTVHDDDQLRVVLFKFAPGEELSEHTSTHAAILYFVEGEARLKLGGDIMDAHAGTWAHMTPNLPHSITAQTPTIMLLLMIKPA